MSWYNLYSLKPVQKASNTTSSVEGPGVPAQVRDGQLQPRIFSAEGETAIPTAVCRRKIEADQVAATLQQCP